MPTELDQIIGECKSILAQCQISANQAAAAAASIGAAGLAPLDSPVFVGTPMAPTPAAGDISTRIATTAFLGGKLAQPNGIATLDNSGLVPLAQLPFSGLSNQGTWNAATNTPHLTSGSGVGGNFYIVTVAGSTTLDGVSSWAVGDWALFSQTAWTKVPAVPPAVSNLPLSALAGQAPGTVVANTGGGTASPAAVAIDTLRPYFGVTTVGGSGLCPALTGGTGVFLRGDGGFETVPGPDLSGYAPLASPSFTGTATVVTQARNLNSTAIASTAFVIAQLGGAAEAGLVKVDGTSSTGTSTYGARIDHIHPTDTSRMAAAGGSASSPTVTGTMTMTGTMNVTGAIILNGSALGGTQSGSIPSGSLMLFQQTSAPTGWTKQTTHNDKALRVVSGAAGSGGSVAFSTFFGRTATDPVTLSISNMPAHNHDVNVNINNAVAGLAGSSFWANTAGDGANLGANSAGSNNSLLIQNAGSGTAFSPAIDCRVQYVDLIIASKN